MSPTFPFDDAHTENPGPGVRPSSIDRWEDEGGLTVPKRRAPRGSVMTPGRPLSEREQRDTATGCRARAEADLLKSATLATLNERLRMETSAASWSARAELLGRIEDSASLRREAAADGPDNPSPYLRS